MKELNNIQAVYFLGIGGIGMSALARYFSLHGKMVAGYDRTPSDTTEQLGSLGIEVHFDDNISSVPEQILQLPKEQVLVVITPAIPPNHTERNYFIRHGYTLAKRAEVLGMIIRNSKGIGIAGTHGKTTTSAITSHLLHESGMSPSAFVGGIMVNYDTNFLAGNGDISVVEADEFDRSFLKLSPSIAVITSVDADHLDIYGNEESFREGFLSYARCLIPGGKLIVQESLKSLFGNLNPVTYGFSADADVRAVNVRVDDGRYVFDVEGLITLPNLSLTMAGRHNVLNALAAITACYFSGVDMQKIPPALYSFKGVKRRFERVYESDSVCYIDDYAHHPKELEACIDALRELYPGKKVYGAFQPHLFTRTRDFAKGFSEILSKLDYLFLLPIYPARELPIEGVTSEMLSAAITCPHKIVQKENLPAEVKKIKSEIEVFVTMGAGDIDREVVHLKKVFADED